MAALKCLRHEEEGRETCPFCVLSGERILLEDSLVVAFRDAYPVSTGHTLVIPRRHVASFQNLTDDEALALFRLARQVAHNLTVEDASIDGFNFGVNDGVTAGQSVFHCHLHVIPRRVEDHPAPRGGVRAVMPRKADYVIKPSCSDVG